MQTLIVYVGVLFAATSVNGFGFGLLGGGGGCGCARPPPPPPPPACAPLPVPVCPAPPPPACPVYQPPPPPPPAPCGCPPPVQIQSCAPPPRASNDCCNKCANPCKYKTKKAFGAAISQRNVNAVCNSEQLRNIMLENMSDSTSDSKRAVQQAAQEKLKGRFDVICSTGDFSYVVNSNFFCQETHNDVTCYAFRQL